MYYVVVDSVHSIILDVEYLTCYMLNYVEQVVDELVAHNEQVVAVDNLACKMFLIVVHSVGFHVYFFDVLLDYTFYHSYNYNNCNYAS